MGLKRSLQDITRSEFDDSLELGVGEGSSFIYLLRTVQQHHVQLSAMADQKASFLIASSFVMLTLLIGQVDAGEISAAVVIPAFTTMIASFFAVLAVLPRHHHVDPRIGTLNPLFFGTFAKLSPDEYAARMEAVMANDRTVYHAMLMDIYQMGKVLNDRKYRFLRFSYQVFLVGLSASFVAAILELGMRLPATA